MISVNPEDRWQQSSRKISTSIILILVIFAVAAAAATFWYFSIESAKYNEVYKRLGISPLPSSIEIKSEVHTALDQLNRERCYKAAAVKFSYALQRAGYPRESALSLVNFGKLCGGLTDEMLELIYTGYFAVSDFPAALKVADDLVVSDPANADYRNWRAQVYSQIKKYDEALLDYISAVQLLGEPQRIAGSEFYNISLTYAAMKRFCDAITPIETFISFDPINRRTAPNLKLIADYAHQGNCDANFATGFTRLPLLGADGIRLVTVNVNGVTGNFILDTGATYVAITSDFAARAGLKVNSKDQLTISVVGGSTSAALGYADTVSVGKAEARGVAVAVLDKTSDPFGGVDGLLGMSFLARFKITLSQSGGEITAIPLR